jgi:hypothetical protein
MSLFLDAMTSYGLKQSPVQLMLCARKCDSTDCFLCLTLTFLQGLLTKQQNRQQRSLWSPGLRPIVRRFLTAMRMTKSNRSHGFPGSSSLSLGLGEKPIVPRASEINSNYKTLHTSPLLGKDWLLLRRIRLSPECQPFWQGTSPHISQ